MRVLIVKTSSMGDIIHTLPAITEAKNNIPDIKFDWVVENNFKEIPFWHGTVEHVIPLHLRNKKDKKIKQLIKYIRAKDYDLVIDAQGLIKSSLITFLAKSKIKAGLDFGLAREFLASIFYNKKIHLDTNQHAIYKTKELFAKCLNYEVDKNIDYGITWNNIKSSIKILDNSCMFLHATTWESKHWPKHYWVELANKLAEDNIKVYITYANLVEKSRAEYLKNNSKNIFILPKISLTDLAGIMQKFKFIIGVDTGLLHLANAINIPTISIFGPTDSYKTGTIGTNHQNITSEIDCRPCLKRQCKFNNNQKNACMTLITPDIIKSKIKL